MISKMSKSTALRVLPSTIRLAPRLGSRCIASKPEQDTYSYLTPPFYKTRREDLSDKWDKLGFAIRPMNGHVRFTWSDGAWDEGVFVPAPYQLMHINSGALHYGISVFEGMKAFAGKDGKVRLLNPEMNAMRMQRGADALLMPQVPKEMFVKGVKEAVRRNREFVPPYGNHASMYIRPLLFASGQMLGLAPLAKEYTFFVTVMPAGGYFSGGKGEEGLVAMVSEEHDRAAPKGLGAVKAAGNYAADLFPVHDAHKKGFGTTLYLDAKERRYLEEFSVANFVGITHDGRYVTPKSETILASTTNKMLQQIAASRGMIVEERPVDIQEIEDGTFKEVGMCGTAAVVVKVRAIRRGDKEYSFSEFDTIASLRKELVAIQEAEAEDKFGWMQEVCDVFDESEPVLPVKNMPTEMITAEAKGTVSKLGPDSLHGHERELLSFVVKNAEPGNPDSVLAAMDQFWSKTTGQAAGSWNVRGQIVEDSVLEIARKKVPQPVKCLELGTYCGYSTLRIAKNLPSGSMLLSVERDNLFAAIATKIIEFAGLDSKVKIWMGDVHSEISNITERLGGSAADFVLVDHSKERFVPDLKLLNECGIVNSDTTVVGDVEIYPGDEKLSTDMKADIQSYFEDQKFVLATIV